MMSDDAALIAKLARRGTSDPDADELIHIFIEESAKIARELDKAAREDDVETFKRLMHRLKGSSAIYGFIDLSNFAGEAEGHQTHGPQARTAAIVGDVIQRIQQIYGQPSSQGAAADQ